MTWAPDYCDATQLQEYLRIDDDLDIEYVDVAVAAASRAIDKACGRQFGKDATPTTRYYTGTYSRVDRTWVVSIDDLMDTTGLVVSYDQHNDQSYDGVVSTHRLLPLNAPAQGKPYTSLWISSGVASLQYGVSVTASFGWSAVPAGVVQATWLQASRFLARRDSPYGIAGSPETGSEMRLLDKLDPDVEVSLAPYKRKWWVAR